MKVGVFLAIAVLVGLTYYVINYHSPFQTEVTDPHYVEIRVDVSLPKGKIELVGIGKMNSYEDCQVRALLYWSDHLKDLGNARVDSKCKKEISPKYLKLFENKQTTATYVAYDKGKDEERDARFLIYGVPSSIAYELCQKMLKNAVDSPYTGKIYCVKGSVG